MTCWEQPLERPGQEFQVATNRMETEQRLYEVLVRNMPCWRPALPWQAAQAPGEDGYLDLPGVDGEGKLVVFELKWEKTHARRDSPGHPPLPDVAQRKVGSDSFGSRCRAEGTPPYNPRLRLRSPNPPNTNASRKSGTRTDRRSRSRRTSLASPLSPQRVGKIGSETHFSSHRLEAISGLVRGSGGGVPQASDTK